MRIHPQAVIWLSSSNEGDDLDTFHRVNGMLPPSFALGGFYDAQTWTFRPIAQEVSWNEEEHEGGYPTNVLVDLDMGMAIFGEDFWNDDSEDCECRSQQAPSTIEIMKRRAAFIAAGILESAAAQIVGGDQDWAKKGLLGAGMETIVAGFCRPANELTFQTLAAEGAGGLASTCAAHFLQTARTNGDGKFRAPSSWEYVGERAAVGATKNFVKFTIGNFEKASLKTVVLFTAKGALKEAMWAANQELPDIVAKTVKDKFQHMHVLRKNVEPTKDDELPSTTSAGDYEQHKGRRTAPAGPAQPGKIRDFYQTVYDGFCDGCKSTAKGVSVKIGENVTNAVLDEIFRTIEGVIGSS